MELVTLQRGLLQPLHASISASMGQPIAPVLAHRIQGHGSFLHATVPQWRCMGGKMELAPLQWRMLQPSHPSEELHSF